MGIADTLSIGYPKPMLSAKQIRAARAMLDWTQVDLARAAGVSIAALNNIEREVTDARSSTISAIEAALLAAGIDVLPDRVPSRGGGQGVRLRRSR